MESSQETAALQYYETSLIGAYCSVAASALLIYELNITLADEIQYAWKSSARSYKIIFALNRFVMVGLACGNVLGLFNFTTFPSVEAISVIQQASSIMTYVVWPAFSALRVYAIWDRYWPPAMLALILGGVPAVTNLVRAILTRYVIESCGFIQSILMSFDTQRTLEIVTRSCLIASDAIVMAATWYKLRSYAFQFERLFSLSNVLIVDGALYFSLLLLLNVMNLVLYLTQTLLNFADITNAVEVVLISRLMLHLREACFSSDDSTVFRARANVTEGNTLMFLPPSNIDHIMDLPDYYSSDGIVMQMETMDTGFGTHDTIGGDGAVGDSWVGSGSLA